MIPAELFARLSERAAPADFQLPRNWPAVAAPFFLVFELLIPDPVFVMVQNLRSIRHRTRAWCTIKLRIRTTPLSVAFAPQIPPKKKKKKTNNKKKTFRAHGLQTARAGMNITLAIAGEISCRKGKMLAILCACHWPPGGDPSGG